MIIAISMTQITYSDIFNKDTKLKFPILFACKYKRSVLIGPKILNEEDLLNFKKRFAASSFVDYSKFSDVNFASKKMASLISTNSRRIKRGIVLEFEDGCILKVNHYILKVPIIHGHE